MTWESTVAAVEDTVAAESFRERGFDSVEGTAVAVFEGRKISSLTFTLSPATTQRRRVQEPTE